MKQQDSLLSHWDIPDQAEDVPAHYVGVELNDL